MDAAIVNGVFTLAGVLVGGVVSFFIAKDKKEMTALNRQIKELQEKNSTLKNEILGLCNQISAYWNVEKEYAKRMGEFTHEKPRTVLKKTRDFVEQQGYERPKLTSENARKILEKCNSL